MKRNDIIFSLICGLAVAWVATDFAPTIRGAPGWITGLIIFVLLPVLSVSGFLLCDILGRKFLFIRQAGKFVLAGAFADVIDIKVFQIVFLFLPVSLLVKAVSFIIATAIKYWANKHWTFEQHSKDEVGREAVGFFVVTLIGLAIDIVSFYYFKKIQVGISAKLWVELSIIFAALVASIWNFLGYKFLVFKK